MKKIKLLLLSLALLMIILQTPGCKAWEGRFAIAGFEGGTAYFQDTDQSQFAFLVRIANQERVGVGAIISDWEFGIYEDDHLILQITQANYDSFNFRVTLAENKPIPDTSTDFPGLLNVVSGREIDNYRVAGNLWGDKTPNRIAFRVLITDFNSYSQILEGEFQISHSL